MTRILGILLISILTGCATGSARREPPPGGPDARAEFARELRQAENETFAGRVDARLEDRSAEGKVSAGGLEVVERGSAEGTIPARRADLGAAFYFYSGLGVLLLLYLIYLLVQRAREPRVRIRA